MAGIFVIHENDAWVEPLRAAFVDRDPLYEKWFPSEGMLGRERACHSVPAPGRLMAPT
jgi:hypothetical protein